MAPPPELVVLASASPTRAALLRAAGVEFSVAPAAVDEDSLKRQMRQDGESAAGCAIVLATEKAVAVSRHDPAALVIGGDQVLVIGVEWFDKPADLDAARRQLLALRGRTHVLATAVCVARAGIPVWRAVGMPELTMRRFSDAFLDAYIAAEGELLLGSVGSYRLEGRGVQLFSRVGGDHFAVLGLPLLDLLSFLRERGALPA